MLIGLILFFTGKLASPKNIHNQTNIKKDNCYIFIQNGQKARMQK